MKIIKLREPTVFLYFCILKIRENRISGPVCETFMTKKIYVVLTLCLLFIGLPISATAQKATVIKGIVRDSITHEPISYASVFFVGSDKGLMTDDDGKFAVSVRDNFLNVRFSTLGYREKTVFERGGRETEKGEIQ